MASRVLLGERIVLVRSYPPPLLVITLRGQEEPGEDKHALSSLLHFQKHAIEPALKIWSSAVRPKNRTPANLTFKRYVNLEYSYAF